jgi:hypothetical protein
MAERIVRGTEVTRPTPEPLTSSVLDHAQAAGNVQTISGGFGYVNNAGLYVSYNCLDLLVPTAICPDPFLSEEGEYKEFDAAAWQPGFTFAVYGGVQCRLVGLDREDQDREVARVFEGSQGKGIERALAGTRFVASAEPGSDEPVSPYYGQWDAPEDLTPISPVPMAVALALLEGDAAYHYNGLPTIHMPRAAATLLEVSGLIVWKGDLAFTKNGSRVAIGGGYDDPEMLATGLWALSATGEVSIQMSEKINVSAPVLSGMSDTSSGGNGLLENGYVSLAERMFRVGVDCYVAKVTGKAF